MPTIYIDDEPYEIEGEGRNLLDVCLSLGFDIPYFCWHPAMHSAGACRQCAIKEFRDEHDREGRIVMACMTPAIDGVRISIDDPEAVGFRAAVAEWLMVNHPHDCPVCDEGGECHLQDMTVMTGHVYRRRRFPKRTHRNQDLGPHINHEMNRCIQCYRCVRFYNEFAGGDDLDVFGWHDHVYFGRHEDGALQSEFSGNLVEVCPTGTFTDKTLKRHYTRPWDLQTAPSVCVHCGLGCNTLPGERYGVLRRIRNRFNAQVNGFFLCDRGRFGYEFVNSDLRIRQPLLRGDNGLRPADTHAVMERLLPLLRGGRTIGIGSPRASLETNFALRRLVGADRFFSGMSRVDGEFMERLSGLLLRGPGRSPSMQDVAEADAVFILGEDVPNTAPMLAPSLRRAALQHAITIAKRLNIYEYQDAAVREAIQQDTGPLFIATPDRTRIDDIATEVYRAAPDDIARLGFAVAHAIHPSAPSPQPLEDQVRRLAGRIAEELLASDRPLLICGYGCGSIRVIEAATNIVCALEDTGKKVGLCCPVPECNSMGVTLMEAGDAQGALQAAASGTGLIVVAENDLFRRMRRADAEALLKAGASVLAIDHLANETTERADIILPAATFAESSGTLVNNEGRGQRFLQVFQPEDGSRPSWRWLADMIAARDGAADSPWPNLDALLADLATDLPIFDGVQGLAPPATYRIRGQKVPRQPHRYSGRTAMTANVTVRELAPPDDPDTPMSFSMEGYHGRPPSPLVARLWAPGWNSVQALTKCTADGHGPLDGDAPGHRLIEPPSQHELCYTESSPPFAAREDQWLALPACHVFGSDELSIHSPGIAELSPEAYLGMSPADAARLQVEEAQQLGLELGDSVYTLPILLRPDLPRGVVTVPVGLPALKGLQLPSWVRLLTSGLSKRTIGV